MDFKIMKCPVCGAPLDAGPDDRYIICRACDTPLRLNEDATSFLRDPEAFGYGFEKGRQRAQAEEEQRRSGERGSYYAGEPSYRQVPPRTRYQNQGYYNQPVSGQPYPGQVNYNYYGTLDPDVSDKDRWTALIICIFLGPLGGHQFYIGRIGKGILYFFTGGLFFFGWFIDIISLLTGTFKDADGRVLVGQSERNKHRYGNPYGGMPQSNYGGNPQNNYGGSPQNNYGGTPQSNYGGTPQSNYGGTPQNNYSGSPQSNYGGTPQSNYGGTPQNNYGGSPQSSYGGTPQRNYESQPGYSQPEFSQPGSSRQQSGHDDYAEWARKMRKRRKIFLALTILFVLSMLGNVRNGDASAVGTMAICAVVFGILYYRTPRP